MIWWAKHRQREWVALVVFVDDDAGGVPVPQFNWFPTSEVIPLRVDPNSGTVLRGESQSRKVRESSLDLGDLGDY